ncbi:3-keto-L-gulonate-6-phosphate decarboxylase sgbH [Serratia fonticola]|uniref:3-keto-L-gulonate-6-phosphate decarboxylase sgbH n=1 Tax=Serratia fonticola TaxID=47917 RepID=A0A4U9U2B1_SERFO|nr:3-keto-L-gulonate-6-phosphate decarboxylase sgbH [Serratia fonticola]
MTIKPRLQLALDHNPVRCRSANGRPPASVRRHHRSGGPFYVSAPGSRAVGALRERCPQHTLVADLKVADAGATLAEQAFSQGGQLDDSDMRSPPGHHG